MTNKFNAVNWFEIPVTDLGRAKKFYESVLKISLREQQMGPMEMAWFPAEQNAPGATGALVKGPGYEPSLQGSVVYLSVPSIEEALNICVEQGGKMLMPKTSIGEWGFIAQFQDSEGNKVAFHAMT